VTCDSLPRAPVEGMGGGVVRAPGRRPSPQETEDEKFKVYLPATRQVQGWFRRWPRVRTATVAPASGDASSSAPGAAAAAPRASGKCQRQDSAGRQSW
jgi:hypothetical protein